MKPEPRRQEFGISRAIYARLLLAYPQRHRAKYGAAMAQLFRDQCRDAWNESQHWGLLKLWLDTLPDLASTSVLERLAALRERKTMTDTLANLFGFRTAPLSTFFRIFILVFLLVFLASVVITFILPESYASTARIKVESDAPTANGQAPAYDPYFIQTTFEIIQSQLILSNVVAVLNLNAEWGKKYFNGETLKTTETIEILKQRMALAPVKNTKLIAITVYSDDKNEAAQIANAVAQSYRDYRVKARYELAMRSLLTLEDQYFNQGNLIQDAQVHLDSLHTQLGIIDEVDGMDTTLVGAEKAFQEKNTEVSAIQALSPEQRQDALPMIVPDSTLSDLVGKLSDAEQKFAALTNDYSITNIVVMRVASLIAVLNGQIKDRTDGVMAGLETQLAAAKAVRELAGKVQKSKFSAETRPYWEAKRELEQSSESHKMLFAKIQEQKLDMSLPEAGLVQITDPAEPSFAPVKPNKLLDIVLGMVLGILLATAVGGALAVLSHFLSQRGRRSAAA